MLFDPYCEKREVYAAMASLTTNVRFCSQQYLSVQHGHLQIGNLNKDLGFLSIIIFKYKALWDNDSVPFQRTCLVLVANNAADMISLDYPK